MHVVVGFEQEGLVIRSSELGHESQANERHLRLKIHGAWLAHDGIVVFGSKADTCVSYETDSSRIVGTRDFQIVIEARLYACIRAKQQPKVSEARAKQIADIAMHGITIHCPSRPCRRVLAILRIAISHFNIYYLLISPAKTAHRAPSLISHAYLRAFIKQGREVGIAHSTATEIGRQN